MFKATTKNTLITESLSILPDGFTSISIFNKGEDVLFVNDNIEIEPGSSFAFENQPYVIIDESTHLRFNTTIHPLALILKTYYKQVRK